MSIHNQRGLTLIGTIIAAAVASIVILAVVSLISDSAKWQKFTARKYATIDSIQTLRRILTVPTSCSCNFAKPSAAVVFPAVGPGLGNVVVPDLRVYTAADCSTSAPMLTPGVDVPGYPNLKVGTITLTNPTLLTGGMVDADLKITFTVPAGENAPRPLVLPNILLATTTSGTDQLVTGCVTSNTSSSGGGGTAGVTDAPKTCGTGKFCFNGKTVQFTNESGNAIATTFVSSMGSTYRLMFSTASGRNVLFDFADTGSNFTVTAPTGWKSQLCYSHVAPVCAVANYFGSLEFNCGSAIKWYGDYTGDTLSIKTPCP